MDQLHLILIFVGGWYGNYLIKKNKYTESNESLKNSPTEKIFGLPSFSKAILPILIPIGLMCLGTLLKIVPSFIGLEYLIILTKPTAALGIGMLFAFRLLFKQPKKNISKAIKKGFKTGYSHTGYNGNGRSPRKRYSDHSFTRLCT